MSDSLNHPEPFTLARLESDQRTLTAGECQQLTRTLNAIGQMCRAATKNGLAGTTRAEAAHWLALAEQGTDRARRSMLAAAAREETS